MLKNNIFNMPLREVDTQVNHFIQKYQQFEDDYIQLIASENYTSLAVLEATGSLLTNKYAEGYPANRYYAGCKWVDEIESLSISRVKQCFNVKYANVQPHSGSSANQAVFFALLQPGDTVLGMNLASGGHLTHGQKFSFSGKFYKSVNYDVNFETNLLDFAAIEELAIKHKPKLIICGASAYSRIIDYSKFKIIADKVGAYLLADIAHISGLIATKQHMSPSGYADVITSTTQKTLRGPRGGIILSNDEAIAKKIDKAVFPGLQGGPLEHVIAGKAVCFKEAMSSNFTNYIKNLINNNKTMVKVLLARGINILTGGTDNNLFIIDLSKLSVSGKTVENALEQAHIICNKNVIPYDKRNIRETSGIRIGSAASTTRGFGTKECTIIANCIADIIFALDCDKDVDLTLQNTLAEVRKITTKFKTYSY